MTTIKTACVIAWAMAILAVQLFHGASTATHLLHVCR